MCKRLIMLISVVLVLGVVSGAPAADKIWTNAVSNDDTWCDDENWDPEGEPIAGDKAWIDQKTQSSPDRGPVIGTDCAAVAAGIEGPNPADANTQVIDINGTGTLTVSSAGDAWMWREGTGEAIVNISDSAVVNITGQMRGTDNGISTINISGSPTITIGENLRGGDESGWFYFNMSGGYLEIGQDAEDDFAIGDNGGGDINMSGGKIICHGTMDMGGLRGSAPININMTGGLIRVEGPFRFPGSASRGGNIQLNLDGGAIDCNEFLHGGSDDGGTPSYTDDWRVDIEGGGELRIWGDVKAEIDANVAAGQITAYDGEGTVLVQLIDGNTVVTGFPADPNTATSPYPPSRSRQIDPNVVCHWTAGIQATSHDVYFGTDFDDVNQGTGGTFIGNQGPNTFDPCGAADLNELTTYYWRIDEKNGGTFKGRVWHFTTKGPVIDPNMKVWYKLDEASGFAAADSSGYANDGAADGPEALWDPCNGHNEASGGSRIFDEDGEEATVIDVPSTALDTMGRGVTIIGWLKDNFDRGSENWFFNTGYGGENGPWHLYAAIYDGNGQVAFRAGNDACDVMRADLDSRAGWHHYAFVKDEILDKMYIYFDGEELASKSDVDDTLVNIKGAAFKLGSTTWSANYDFTGAMDDFKVFDYALSALQVGADFRGGNLALAWAPSPGVFEQDVRRDANLAWKPGDFADHHRVYLGTDRDDVAAATTSTVGIYQGQQDPCEYDPCMFELDTTYYWRIDEVNDPCLWKGPIWQFTVANFIVVDDFESYDNATNKVFNTWEDGNVNLTGSFIDLGVEPFDPAHAGSQSMLYVYDNTIKWDWDHYWSDANLPFDSPQDFTDVDTKVLALYFYGQRGNDIDDTEQLYVGLQDDTASAIVNYTDDAGRDMNDLERAEWTEWNIEFSEFSGVDPCAVTGLSIGFGDRTNTDTVGGEGRVYFDDIRLYPSRCVPSIIKPAADLSKNCIVDWADVGLMAIQWLRADANLNPVTNPGTANLVGHWKLDGNADDSSVNANHGAIMGKYAWVSGHDGMAARFTNGRVLVPDALELRPPAQVSAAIWMYYSGNRPGSSSRIMVKGGDNFESYALEVNNDEHITFYVGDVNGERYFADSPENAVYADEWMHLAGTYDGTISKCWINGEVAGTNTDANATVIPLLSQDPNGLGIGNRSDANNRPLNATVDDARVYNRALTAAEVAWLATDGTGYMALTSTANLHDNEPANQKAINIRDIAILIGDWGQERLWP